MVLLIIKTAYFLPLSIMEHIHHHSHSDQHQHHGHSHSHTVELKSVNTAFITGIVLNLAFVVVEVIAGLVIHSLSLLSDAGHNLADVASLGLALFAFRMLKVKSNATYTYGYKKTTVLVALLNGGILLVSIGAILFESVQRLIDPRVLPGKTISLVAGIGILVNGLTALLFFRSRENDLNIKGAFLHLMADTVVSAALVVGGILIYFTHWYWVDPLLGIAVAIAIVFSTWKLLRDSLRLSLDAVPQGINLATVRDLVKKINGVRDFHHIHIWALSTMENALTGHVVLERGISIEDQEKIKQEIKHQLLHASIQHVTLETETEALACESISNY
ncbi:MAG TPA: cation diffusion facilitator family transporter [Puia sp.]|nr:cation diffusion facilitator family transporter [Puia sp.]